MNLYNNLRYEIKRVAETDTGWFGYEGDIV